MANAVAQEIAPVDILAPIGCHYHCADGVWEVTLFVGMTEVVGGRTDGIKRRSRFSVRLGKLDSIFAEVEHFHWQTHTLGSTDDLGPHISLEGKYQGHPVWLRILASPPRRFPAARQAWTNEAELKELW